MLFYLYNGYQYDSFTPDRKDWIAPNSKSIWQYFLKHTVEEKAMCLNCKKVLKTIGGSTKGLHNHLKTHGFSDKISDGGPKKKHQRLHLIMKMAK